LSLNLLMTTARRVICTLALLFLLINVSIGQDEWSVYGIVSDGNTELAYATVYANPIHLGQTLDTILTFTTTDDHGAFTLDIDSSFKRLLLVVNYLGYETSKIELGLDTPLPLKIQLEPSSHHLSEVIVTDQIAPIIERGDTIKYDAKQFVDSSVDKVEDLLKNIPGIEVEESGLIKVDGKPIKKVLIEDTDMFDSQYTIGTQNLSADYIKSVEVIDGYQENEVLKDIVSSEEIVLNLRLKEDVKNKLAGNIDEGVGFGDELKALLETNIFSVSKKQKFLLIGNNGNVGTHYSLNDVKISSNLGNKGALTSEINPSSHFTNRISTNHLGINKEYVDNSISLFNTFRTFFDIKNHSKIKLNLNYASQSDIQNATSDVFSLFQPNLYENRLRQKVQLDNVLLGGDLRYSYLNSTKTQKFDFFLGYQNDVHDGNQEIIEDRNEDVNSEIGLRSNRWLVSSQYSISFSEQSVLILRGKINMIQKKESFLGNNPDFAKLFNLTTDAVDFIQDIDLSNRLGDISAKYLRNIFGLTVSAESGLRTSRVDFLPSWYFSEGVGTQMRRINVPNFKNQRDLTWKNDLGIKKVFNQKNTLSVNTSFFNRTFQQQELTTQFDFAETYGLNVSFTNKINSHAGLNLFYSFYNNPLSNLDFLSFQYVQGNYGFVNNNSLNRITGGHSIGLRISDKNIRKLSSYNLNVTIGLRERRWLQDFVFVNSIVTSQLYFTDNNNQISIKAFWDKFVPKLKTNFEIKPSITLRQSSAVNNESISNTQTINIGSDFTASIPISSFLHLRLDGGIRSYFFKTNGSLSSKILNIKATPYIAFERKDWRLKLFASYQNTLSRNSSFEVLVSKIEFKKPIRIGSYNTDLIVRVNNIFNQQNFSTASNSEFFIFENNVEAISPFIVFTVSQKI